MNESLRVIPQALYPYFIEGSQNEPLISQKCTVLPFLLMVTASQKTVHQGSYHHLRILSLRMVEEDTLDL